MHIFSYILGITIIPFTVGIFVSTPELITTGYGLLFLLCGFIYGLFLNQYYKKKSSTYAIKGIIIIPVLGSFLTSCLFSYPFVLRNVLPSFLDIIVGAVMYIFGGGIFTLVGFLLNLALEKWLIYLRAKQKK